MKKEINFEAFETLQGLLNKTAKFGGIFRIDELTCGAFTVIFKNGLQAMASNHRINNLMYFLRTDKEFNENDATITLPEIRYRQADLY